MIKSCNGKQRPAYDLDVHRHRFAVWAAARAMQRGLAGGKLANLASATEDTSRERRQCLRVDSQAAFDKAHRAWSEAFLEAMRQHAPTMSYGHAAKFVNIYLKTVVVCGGGGPPGLAAIIHPPIDEMLLKALARDQAFDENHRSLWRDSRWTTFSYEDYIEVIASLRAEGLDQPGFWMVERYWEPGSFR